MRIKKEDWEKLQEKVKNLEEMRPVFNFCVDYLSQQENSPILFNYEMRWLNCRPITATIIQYLHNSKVKEIVMYKDIKTPIIIKQEKNYFIFKDIKNIYYIVDEIQGVCIEVPYAVAAGTSTFTINMQGEEVIINDTAVIRNCRSD